MDFSRFNIMAAVFPPLQDHDKHSFPQDCKVVARIVLGGLHMKVKRMVEWFVSWIGRASK
jgi:hypothetical protein